MTTWRKGNIRLAVAAIGSNKVRSFLTMLGIIIGVAAVVTVVCIGEGVKSQINRQSARFGKGVLVVRSDVKRHTGAGGLVVGGSRALTAQDLETVRSSPDVETAVPVGSTVGAVSADKKIDDPLIITTTPGFAKIVSHPIEHGGFFDSDPESKTAVLGPDVASRLFEDNIPLGQSFTWRGEKIMVAGIFKRFAAPPLSVDNDYNSAIFIPTSTARSLIKTDPEIYQIFVQPKAGINESTAVANLNKRLVAAHGGTHDTAVEAADRAHSDSGDETMRLLTMMTIGVAIISLLVGGVGIMNVMLVSVTERTQEVGLRKAIGATNGQILRQFMAEALVLSIIGAAIGLVVAFSAIGFIRLYTTLQPVVVWPVVFLAPLAAVATGVLFGTFPAAKAARKDPIEALRRF